MPGFGKAFDHVADAVFDPAVGGYFVDVALKLVLLGQATKDKEKRGFNKVAMGRKVFNANTPILKDTGLTINKADVRASCRNAFETGFVFAVSHSCSLPLCLLSYAAELSLSAMLSGADVDRLNRDSIRE